LDDAEGVSPNFENLEAIVGHNYFLKRYHLAVYHKVSPVQISLLLPTRGRPSNILRLYRSAMDLADDPSRIEFIVAIDDDDSSYDELITRGLPNVTFFKIPRTVLSVYWNKCYEKATGEILHHCGDDLIFKTKSWDTVVVSAFEKVPDKVLFAFGNDGHWGESFGTHGFIHRKWAETVGYFVPPYFSSDYNDTWLNDVAKELGRHQYIEIFTEHMHPTFHKAEWDDNHKERLIRHQKDNVDEMYRSKHDERVRDAEKLRRVMQ
jgi:hypothetical protein